MSLYVHRSGSPTAPTIVLLHGSGVSSWMWNEQITVLQSAYQCLAIDLPGNGESHQTEWVSLSDTADQIVTIIRQSTVNGKAHIVGLSLGGYTGLRLLENHPDVVESLIVSGVSTKSFANMWRWQIMLGVMQRLMKWDVFINMQAKMLHIPAEAAALYKRDNKRMSSESFNRMFNEVLRFTLPNFTGQQSAPLLAVAGDSENAMIKDGLKDFANYKQNTVAALVPNAHHGWNGEHPQLFTDMVAAWIQQKPLPSGLRVVEAG